MNVGDRPPGPASSAWPPTTRRHRGGLILALGLLGWLLCPLCSLLAVVLGWSDLAAIRRGEVERDGEGTTLAGTILGAVQVAILGLVLVAIAAAGAIAAVVALVDEYG